MIVLLGKKCLPLTDRINIVYNGIGGGIDKLLEIFTAHMNLCSKHLMLCH